MSSLNICAQSTDWYTRGLADLVQHFAYRRSSHRYKGGARHLSWFGLAISLTYLSREEVGILLVQIISTCLRGSLYSPNCTPFPLPPPRLFLPKVTNCTLTHQCISSNPNPEIQRNPICEVLVRRRMRNTDTYLGGKGRDSGTLCSCCCNGWGWPGDNL